MMRPQPCDTCATAALQHRRPWPLSWVAAGYDGLCPVKQPGADGSAAVAVWHRGGRAAAGSHQVQALSGGAAADSALAGGPGRSAGI